MIFSQTLFFLSRSLQAMGEVTSLALRGEGHMVKIDFDELLLL